MSHQMLFNLVHLCVSACALLVTSFVIPGFEVKNFFSGVVAALVIGVVNFFIGPVLIFLTFPLTIVTLGLFLFVVDAIILKISAALIPGFEIHGWGSAIFGAFILSMVGTILHAIIA